MSDSVYLLVDKRKIEDVWAYAVEADIYTPADGFNIEIKPPSVPIPKGALCELYVNNKLELTGICDRIVLRYSKDEVKCTLEGRDLCGLLVDSCCEEFKTVQNATIKELAESLLKNVPFINKKAIVYEEDFRGSLKKKKGKGGKTGKSGSPAVGRYSIGSGKAAHAFAQIQPGQTILDVLKIYCQSRGFMMWVMPDGTFVFGTPKEGGQPLYSLATRKSNPQENNIIDGIVDENLSKRYSKVTVTGQQQGTNSQGGGRYSSGSSSETGAAGINTKASILDPTFPFYKPYVATDNNDSRSPELHGQMLLDKMKYEGFQIHYTVKGHSQNGLNYMINEMARVTDEVFGFDRDFLIYGRTFRRSKEGVHTVLRLGYPGLVVQ